MEKKGFILIGRIKEVLLALSALAALDLSITNLTSLLSDKEIFLKPYKED